MASNITDSEKELIFILTTTVYTAFSIAAVIPLLILTLLCIMALFLARVINLKIRMLLINILAVEFLVWFAGAFFFLGYPKRDSSRSLTSCRFINSLYIITGLQKYAAVSLFATVVYYFIKDGVDRIKWYFIVPVIAGSWGVSIGLGVMPYFEPFWSYSMDNVDFPFCDNTQAPLGIAIFAPLTVGVLVCIVVITVFGVLTFCFIKKNTLQNSVDVKRSIAKTLLYLLVVSIVALINLILPPSSSSL